MNNTYKKEKQTHANRKKKTLRNCNTEYFRYIQIFRICNPVLLFNSEFQTPPQEQKNMMLPLLYKRT